MITLATLQEINVLRAKKWHKQGLDDWSPLEWCGAMCGEAGEAANVAKKLRRVDFELANHDARLKHEWASSELAAKYRIDIAKECADTLLYAVLTTARVGGNIEEVVASVFNAKSIEYGFPERI